MYVIMEFITVHLSPKILAASGMPDVDVKLAPIYAAAHQLDKAAGANWPICVYLPIRHCSNSLR